MASFGRQKDEDARVHSWIKSRLQPGIYSGLVHWRSHPHFSPAPMFQKAQRYLPNAANALVARGDDARKLVQQGASFLQAYRYEVPDTTVWALAGTTFNLLNGTTGPGLLALPLAFARCGWLLGLLLLLLVFTLNHVALLFLLKACLATREHSYIGLSLRSSPELASLVDWASLAFFFGSCVSYLVIIGDTFGTVTAMLGSGSFFVGGEAAHFSTLALMALVIFTGAVLAPLSMLRDMDSLQPTSGIAMACILYAVAVVVLALARPRGRQKAPRPTQRERAATRV